MKSIIATVSLMMVVSGARAQYWRNCAELTETYTGFRFEADKVHVQTQGPGCSVTPVSSPVRAGKTAFKHVIVNSCERAEIVAYESVPGETEFWMGWSYMIGKGSSSGIAWQCGPQGAWQLRKGTVKFTLKCGNPIGCDMDIKGTTIDLRLTYAAPGSTTKAVTMNCKHFKGRASPAGKWTDLVIHAKYSATSGFFEMWSNGTKFVDYKGPVVLIPGVNQSGYMKIGTYVGNPGKGSKLVYTDELRIAGASATFADVDPAAAEHPMEQQTAIRFSSQERRVPLRASERGFRLFDMQGKVLNGVRRSEYPAGRTVLIGPSESTPIVIRIP